MTSEINKQVTSRETASANTAMKDCSYVGSWQSWYEFFDDLSLDKMRKEILDVVAKYVEIDFEGELV